MDRIPIKTNPRLFDKTFASIQKQIGEKITWLDHVFGLCERITEQQNGKRFKSANVYIGKDQYEQVMPCDELGNFCFFMLRDPQERRADNRNTIYAPFYGVFWYNERKISSSPDERNREAIKEEILGVLNTIRSPYIEWGNIYENPENIFSDFSYDFIDNQFLMSPYAGIRVEGRVRVSIPCWGGECGDFNDDYNNDFNNQGNCQPHSFDKSFNSSFDIKK